MVIRLDSIRVKDVVDNKAEPIGVDGDAANVLHGVSEADKILEGARKSMASAGIADDPEAADQTNEAILERMANSDEEPGPELSVDDQSHLPSVDILKPPENRETR
jgi:protein phosphatase PTC1